jgi:hypothetical protein
MKRLVLLALAVAMLGLVGTAVAEEKADPTGTWKWTTTFGNQSREQTLKLKLEGDKLTGALVGRNDQETAIEDATYKDGTVSFKVTRERNDQRFVSKYNGKVEGDTIKGKIETERQGQAQSRDWEAKRAN